MPIVYDLYSFLSALPGVEVVPCSFGDPVNPDFGIQALRLQEAIYFRRDQITADHLERTCRDRRIDFICVAWLLEIRELAAEITKLRRPALLFPHGFHSCLDDLDRFPHVHIFGGRWTPAELAKEPVFEFYISRRFAIPDGTCNPGRPKGIFFCGDSNIRMNRRDKLAFLSLIEAIAPEQPVTITENLLATLFPYRLMLLRRLVSRLLRVPCGASSLNRYLKRRALGFSHFLDRFRGSANVRVLGSIPYGQLASAIQEHRFVEATPSHRCEHLPARATVALASGKPILLKRGLCPTLEKLVQRYGIGYLYDNHEELLSVVNDQERVTTMEANARQHRELFTLEWFSEEFTRFLAGVQKDNMAKASR